MERLHYIPERDNQADQLLIELLPTKDFKSSPKAVVTFVSQGEIVIGGNKSIEIIATLARTSLQNPINAKDLVRNVWGEESSENSHKFTACMNRLHNLISKLNLKISSNNIPYEIVRKSNGKRMDNLEVLYYLNLKKDNVPSFVVFPSDQGDECGDD